MKAKNYITTLLFTIFIINSCKKNDTPECGCDSEILTTIPIPNEARGIISYNKQLDPNYNYYVNKYLDNNRRHRE